jgi:uncharacterized protein (DUF2147 family)
MSRRVGAGVILLFAAILIGPNAIFPSMAMGASPLGEWLTANGHGVVQMSPCGDAFCGRIVGIDRKPAEPMPTDVNGSPQCGLTIITNQKPEAAGLWAGEITDPRDGGKYQARIWLDDRGDLHLRGFIGIPAFGATQIWHKFTGHLTSGCGMS